MYINQSNNANTCQHIHILVLHVKIRIKSHKHRLPVSNNTPKNGQNGNDSQGRLQSHKKTSKNDRKKQRVHAISLITHKQLKYV
jgi:hypothetical protein